jgi:hypothetical protein
MTTTPAAAAPPATAADESFDWLAFSWALSEDAILMHNRLTKYKISIL